MRWRQPRERSGQPWICGWWVRDGSWRGGEKKVGGCEE